MTSALEPPSKPPALHVEIRRHRLESGKSIREVSEETGISRTHVTQCEMEGFLPRLPIVDALDKAYGANGYLLDLWHRTSGPRQQIVVTGGNNVISAGRDISIGRADAGGPAQEQSGPATLSEQRQKFHFNYLNRSLTQSTVMFWVSVGFMILGAIIILTSGGIAIFRDGGQGLDWVTGLSGALITAAGGALHRKARQKEAEVAKVAEEVAAKVESDDRFQKATAVIERIEDPKIKDRAKTTVVLTQLGFEPNADDVARRLLQAGDDARPEVTRGPESEEPGSR